jgi:uncharacterized repeat protein (TIGR03847 family)
MELGPVDRITAGAIGEPGMRTFFIQARRGDDLATVIVEKQQVQLLASSILELLADLGIETGTGPGEDEMELEVPFEPLWRAGRLSIGWDDANDRFMLEIEEFRPEPEDLDPDDPRSAIEDEAETLCLAATKEQMFALSRHGAAAVERGRPACQFCGNPMDPEGHSCPAMNGHSTPS